MTSLQQATGWSDAVRSAEAFARDQAKRFRDNKMRSEKFEMKVCRAYDFALEVANEASDIYFTFAVLAHTPNQAYFYASIVFLSLTLVMRLTISLSQWQDVHPLRKKRFFCAILIGLMEPMLGQRILVSSLDADSHGPLKRAAIAKADTRAMRNIG